MPIRRQLTFILTVLNVCTTVALATPPATNPTTSTSPRSPADPEFIAAAKKFQRDVESKNDAAADFIDGDAIFNAVAANVPVDDKTRNQLLGPMKKNGFTFYLRQFQAPGSTHPLLNVFQQDGLTHAIFRVTDIQGNLNYHDMILRRSPDGIIRASDIYMAGTGEYLSQTLRRIYIMTVTAIDETLPEKLPATDRFFEDQKVVYAIMQNMLKKNYRDVLADCAKLRGPMKNEKLIFICRTCATSALGDIDGFEQAVTEYKAKFPNDPSLDLLSVTLGFTKKDYDTVRTSLDHLEKWTGGDPFLEVSRSNLIMLEAKPQAAQQAEKLLRAVLITEPNLPNAHFFLVKSLALQSRFNEAVFELGLYERLIQVTTPQNLLKQCGDLTSSKPYLDYRAKPPTP